MNRLLLLCAAGLFWLLSFNSGESFFFHLAYLTTGLGLISYIWARVGMRGIVLSRFASGTRSQVGQRVDEVFELANQGRLPKLWVELQDYSTLPFHDASRVVSNLSRNSRRRWQVPTICHARGRFRLGPLHVRTSDPLGLFPQQRFWPETSSILVFPAVTELPRFAPAVADMAGDERVRLRTPIATTNAASVRDYAPGDSQTRIHWLSTARTGRLIAKEFELDRSAHVRIFLDLFREVEIALPWQPEAGSLPRLTPRRQGRRRAFVYSLPPSTTEYAVAATASVARYFTQKGRAIGFAAYGQTHESLTAERGERQLGKILEALAVLNADGDVPLADFILADGFDMTRHDTLIVFTPDPNPAWVQALLELRLQGINAMAVVMDAESFDPDCAMQPVWAALHEARVPFYRILRDQKLQDALAGDMECGPESSFTPVC